MGSADQVLDNRDRHQDDSRADSRELVVRMLGEERGMSQKSGAGPIDTKSGSAHSSLIGAKSPGRRHRLGGRHSHH